MAFALFNPCQPCCTPGSGSDTVSCCTDHPYLTWQVYHRIYDTSLSFFSYSWRLAGLGNLQLEADGKWHGFVKQSMVDADWDMLPFEIASGQLECLSGSQMLFTYDGAFSEAGTTGLSTHTFNLPDTGCVGGQGFTLLKSQSISSVVPSSTNPNGINTVYYHIQPNNGPVCPDTGILCFQFQPDADALCSGIYQQELGYNPTIRDFWEGSGGPLQANNHVIFGPVHSSGYEPVIYPCQKVFDGFGFSELTFTEPSSCTPFHWVDDWTTGYTYWSGNEGCCEDMKGTVDVFASGTCNTSGGSTGAMGAAGDTSPWGSGQLPAGLLPTAPSIADPSNDNPLVFTGFTPLGGLQLPDTGNTSNYTDYLNAGGTLVIVGDGGASTGDLTAINDFIDTIGGTIDLYGNNYNDSANGSGVITGVGWSGTIQQNFLTDGTLGNQVEGLFYSGTNFLYNGNGTTIATAYGLSSGIMAYEYIGSGLIIVLGDKEMVGTLGTTTPYNNRPLWNNILTGATSTFDYNITGNWICSPMPHRLHLSMVDGTCSGVATDILLNYKPTAQHWFGTSNCLATRSSYAGNDLDHYFYMISTSSYVELHLGSGNMIPDPEFDPFPLIQDSSPTCTPFLANFSGTTSNVNLYCCSGPALVLQVSE